MGQRPRIVIVGGGLAGLASASVLAPAGAEVTLLEAKAKLGGRATSFVDPTTRERVDNCQHVSMGCCTNLARLCQDVGIDGLIDRYESLSFIDERGRRSRMQSWPMPEPLHLAPSFLAARFLSWTDKARIGIGMIALARPIESTEGRSALDWLRAHGQSTRTIDRFWSVVLVSALNETLDRIDVRYARQVFVEGFLANRRAFHLEIPRVPLGEFYGDALEGWLTRQGVTTRRQSAVKELLTEGDRVTGVQLADGEEILADGVILAVEFHRAAELVPTAWRGSLPQIDRLTALEASPITSVHLWYDRPVMEEPSLVVVGRRIQWLFRRPTTTADEQGYVQAVISAAREFASMGAAEMQRIVRQEVEEILPMARGAELRHARVVTERRATYSVVPGVDRYRPKCRLANGSESRRLYLAGDYTETGWPATMEGAVRSGYLSANEALADAGLPGRPLAEPTRMGGIVRWLGGRT